MPGTTNIALSSLSPLWALLTPTGLDVYKSLPALEAASQSSHSFTQAQSTDSDGGSCAPFCCSAESPQNALDSNSTYDHIPYYNILWAQDLVLAEDDKHPATGKPAPTISKPIQLSYMKVKNASSHKLQPTKVVLQVVSLSGSQLSAFPDSTHPKGWNSGAVHVQPLSPPPTPTSQTRLIDGASNIHASPTTASYIDTEPHATSVPDETSRTHGSDSTLNSLDDSINSFTTHAVETVLKYAYSAGPNGTINSSSPSKLQKRFLVIINPHGGPGKAKQVFEKECAPILALARCKTTVIETTHRFHASEIARDTQFLIPTKADTITSSQDSEDDKDQDLEDTRLAYDAIICCSGDGIPHEIINGLVSRPQGDGLDILKQVPLAQLPCGSGNSMAISIHGHASPSAVALGFVKGRKMDVDLMLMTQGDKKNLTFLTQTFGIIADADLGTEDLRWMGGARFDYGIARRLLAMKSYPCDIYVKYSHKSKHEVKQHYISNNKHTEHGTNETIDISQYTTLTEPNTLDELMSPHFGSVNDPVPKDWDHIDGSHLSLFYAGKMPWIAADTLMFPGVLPTDASMDLLISGSNVSRLTTAKMMFSISSGTHVDFDHAQYSKVSAYRLVPKNDKGFLSIDGESFPHIPLQVEVVPRAGCLLSPTGAYHQTGFGL